MFARLARLAPVRRAAASAQQWGDRTAVAAGVAAAAAVAAVACVGATALCEGDAPAMPAPAPASLAPRTVQRATSGLTATGEVTLEALVGRSLSHLKKTSGTVEVRGVAVRWWRYENEARTRQQGTAGHVHARSRARRFEILPDVCTHRKTAHGRHVAGDDTTVC